MDCGCIKGEPGYDFQISVIDTKTISYSDLTEWVNDEPYIIPATHIIGVTLPDNTKLNLQTYVGATTIIKTSDIGINKFKDGIYCFRIDPMLEESGGCGLEYNKTEGIFPTIECCIQKAYSTLDDSKFEDIQEVERWINSSKVAASFGQKDKALDNWKIAKKLLNKLNCECSC